ncbi:MAG: S-layer homology domain-containing protein [Bacillota bacterium]
MKKMFFKRVLMLAAFVFLLSVPGIASADTDIKVLITIPGRSGEEVYEGTTVNTAQSTPVVYYGDNRSLGTLRVSGKKDISNPIKNGDRIMAVLPEGLCYMQAPTAQNFRDYVSWPESIDGVKNKVKKVKFVSGTPRSITLEFEQVDSSDGTVALDFLYNRENTSTVRVAPLIKKAGEFKSDPQGKVTRAEFFEMLGENTLPFSTCPLIFSEDTKPLKERFTDTAGMTSGQLSNTSILVDSGLIEGYEGGLLRPDEYITRAEAAHLAGKIFSQSVKKAIFSDEIPGWASGVHTAAELGIVVGYPDGTFRPEGLIKKQEIINLFQKTIEAYSLTAK